MEEQVNRSQSEKRKDSTQDKMSVTSLLEWQVSTAAGLRDKEEKLRMTMGLADRQKYKIDELRKSKEVLGTDLARRKEENGNLNESLLSMKEEVNIMDKQVKTVSTQIRKIRVERRELKLVKVERSEEVQRIGESLKQLHLTQGCKEKRWKALLKRNEEDHNIFKVKSEKETAACREELKTLEGKIDQLDEKIAKGTDEMYNLEENDRVNDRKMGSVIEEFERAKGDFITSTERRDNTEKELEMKSVMYKEKELDLNSKVDSTVTCLAQVKLTLEEKDVCCNQIRAEVAELEKAVDSVSEKIDKAGTDKVDYEAKLLSNDQLAASYKIKIGAIDEMKGEMRVLGEDLKISEERRHAAEEEYKLLGEVQHEKENLEEENQKLSQDVHSYEANVQSCKNEVSSVQEEVKQMMKNVGLLESEVQALEATVKIKNKQAQKDKNDAEIRGKSVTGAKSSSYELKVKVEALGNELKNKEDGIEERRNRIENLRSDFKNQIENSEISKIKLAGIKDISKTIDEELVSVKKDVAAMTQEAQKLDADIEKVEESNDELEKCTQSARDKLEGVKMELKSDINELNTLEKESRMLEVKTEKLGVSNKKAREEQDKFKADIIQTEEDLKLSLSKMESTDSVKNSIKVKNLDIKNLEKEVKTAKRSQVTANKRKEKLAKQLEKNKLTLSTLESDIEKSNNTMKRAQEILEKLRSQSIEIIESKKGKMEALESLRKDVDGVTAEVEKLIDDVEEKKTSVDQILHCKDKMVSEVKESAQEFEGLLLCKDREYSELKIKATKEVDAMEKTLCALQKELEANLNPVKTSSDDETTSQENELSETRKETEVTKEELAKLKLRLAEKTSEVEKLKMKLQTQKSSSGRTIRTPLRVVLPGGNATNTPQEARKSRHLLPSDKTVPQSPVRSFLAPPSRNTPSSRHPRKKSSKKTTPPVIVDFDSIMGVSDDMDSN